MNHSAKEASEPLLVRLLKLVGYSAPGRATLLEHLRAAEQRNELDADAVGIIEGALQVAEMQVRDIMIPRAQVVSIEVSERLEEFLPKVIESAHSRFPVIDSPDEVIGILLAKDLLPLLLAGSNVTQFAIKEHLRPPVFVPESKRLNVLLREFRANRNHMAVVIDEYGGMAGVVTIEDVLEQIVGEIEDEHDIDDENFIKQYDQHTFVVKAITPIDDFNVRFATSFDEDEFDTIGGIVVQAFGRLPKRNESITIDELTFKVLNADHRRVRLLRVHRATATE